MKNFGGVHAIMRYALVTMLIFSAVIYMVVFFGALQIINIFNSEQNVLLQNIATEGLRLYFIACPFAGFNVIISTYFTSAERPRPAHVISILRGFLVIIPMTFLLSWIGKIHGVWCAFPVTEMLVAVVGVLLFVFIRKRRKEMQI